MAIESRNHQGDVKTLTITFQVQTYKELRALGFMKKRRTVTPPMACGGNRLTTYEQKVNLR
ncbi:hypothetical protein [Pseudomonas gingeri]